MLEKVIAGTHLAYLIATKFMYAIQLNLLLSWYTVIDHAMLGSFPDLWMLTCLVSAPWLITTFTSSSQMSILMATNLAWDGTKDGPFSFARLSYSAFVLAIE